MVLHSRHQSSTDPTERLHAERIQLHFPWSISPFVKETKPSEAEIDDEDEEIEDEKGTPVTQEFQHELKVKIANEVPWIDLILEIAMTTALANLTNNTTISRGKDVLGYLCFWSLTWWVWASTVAYNVRFRQADWVHRWAAIFQLAIFGALAAFTQNFDITNGIGTGDDPNQDRASQVQVQMGTVTIAGIRAREYQQARLPRLNFRGIAMTMAWSRILLMTQYVIVYTHALRNRTNPHRFAPAILVHIFSLALSATAFFASFIILGENPTPADNIAKIPLWYGALVLELTAHFIPPVFGLKGHVRYSARGLYSRASILFLIVLGQGLDQLTGTFSFAVGPTGFGSFSVGLLISTAVVLVAQFSLFFGSATLKKRCVRGLTWFFGQFVYTSAVIVLISATANLLIGTNFNIAKGNVANAVANIKQLATGAFPSMPNVSDIPASDIKPLLTNGIAPEDVLKAIYDAKSTHDPQEEESALLKLSLHIVFTVAEEFNIQPKRSEPLYWDLQWAKNVNETNMLNVSTYNFIIEEFDRAHDTPATWFPAAGGATLIFVALLRYIRQTPRDRWEWANIGTIGGAGIAYALLSFLDIGSNKPVSYLDANYNIIINSPIFKFENSGWVLPSFAILNIVVLTALGLENYFARRSIRRELESRSSTVYEPVEGVHHLREYSQGPLSQQPALHYKRHESYGPFSASHRNLRQESFGFYTDPFSVRRDSGEVIYV